MQAVDVSRAGERPSRADGEPATGKPRLLDIDRTKGFAIALVVFGHTAGDYGAVQPLWFPLSVVTIYGFHMPLFMYLSGFVFFMVGFHNRFWQSPASYIARRFDRLIVPMIAFGAVVVIGKHFAARFGHIDDNVRSIQDGLLALVTNTPDNPCLAIWYLVVLFVYSVLTPALYRVGGIATILVLGVVGWAFATPEAFYLHRIATFYLFFGVGGVVALHRETMLPLFRRLWWPALIVLGVVSYVLFEQPSVLLASGLVAIVAFHGLFLQDVWRSDRVLLTIGRYSMAIYLLNTIAIGLGKLLYLPRLPDDGVWFVAMVASLWCLGVGVPMLILKVLEGFPALRPISRYLR